MKKEFEITNDLIASQGQRFLNHLIDLIIIYFLIIVLALIVSIIASILGSENILLWMENISDLEGYLVFFGVMIPYYILTETFLSRTIGKYITNTIVVHEDGSKPDVNTITKRTFYRIIPFDGLSFLSSPCRGWHDSNSGTYVVRKKDFEKSISLFNDFNEIGNRTVN